MAQNFYQQAKDAGVRTTMLGAYQQNAFLPYGSDQSTFNASDYGITLGKNVIPASMHGGWGFLKESPDGRGWRINQDGQERVLNAIRTDYAGNPYDINTQQAYTHAGTPYDRHLLGVTGVTVTGDGQVGEVGSDPRQQFLAQEYQNIISRGNVSPSSAYSQAIYNLNKITGNDAVNQANLRRSQNYLSQQAKKDRSFGSRLKNFAGVAAAPLALAGGAALAPTLFSAPATGVAAGGAASGGLGSSILAGFSAPQALSGALVGGLGGLASGGDISSALKGAALGGLGGGFGSSIGRGLRLGEVGQQALTGALTGAAGGLATGDMRNALIGAGLGSVGGYLKGGGNVPFLGSMQQQLPSDVFGPARQGTGLLGKLSGTANTGLTIGGQPMRLGSLLSAGGDIYGYMQGQSDMDDIQELLARQSAAAQEQFQPYAQAGQTALENMQAPSMEALQNDPGYQFRLQQGQQALERSLAARGLGQSGAALKAAQEYGQGLADQTYNDFFARQGQLAGMGQSAASGLGSLMTNLGNVRAAAEMERINQRNQLLSSLLGGRGVAGSLSGLGGLLG